MDGKQYDEYLEFTHKFLDTINVENYITNDVEVCQSMNDIDDENFRLYMENNFIKNTKNS